MSTLAISVAVSLSSSLSGNLSNLHSHWSLVALTENCQFLEVIL